MPHELFDGIYRTVGNEQQQTNMEQQQEIGKRAFVGSAARRLVELKRRKNTQFIELSTNSLYI